MYDAAPPLAHLAPSADESRLTHQQAERRLRGLLRDISTEAQRLRMRLDVIKAAAQIADAGKRKSETLSEVIRAYQVFRDNEDSIAIRIVRLHALLSDHPAVHDRYGSEVTFAENEWEDVRRDWPKPTATPTEETSLVEDVQRVMPALQEHLDELVYRCCLVTVPPRLDQHLETLRVGQKLDFHEAFRDELANQADRLRLLHYLRAHPNAVWGVVDVEHGMIHHVSPHRWRRIASYVALVAALFLGLGLAFAFVNVGPWFDVDGWPLGPERWSDLARTYLFVVLGALAHVAVDALKQVRAQGAAPAALDDGLLWVHIKEVPILWSIACLWLGALGMAVTQQLAGWQGAFFVGYSIDSFVDLFLQRFADFTGSGVDSAKKLLKSRSE